MIGKFPSECRRLNPVIETGGYTDHKGSQFIEVTLLGIRLVFKTDVPSLNPKEFVSQDGKCHSRSDGEGFRRLRRLRIRLEKGDCPVLGRENPNDSLHVNW